MRLIWLPRMATFASSSGFWPTAPKASLPMPSSMPRPTRSPLFWSRVSLECDVTPSLMRLLRAETRLLSGVSFHSSRHCRLSNEVGWHIPAITNKTSKTKHNLTKPISAVDAVASTIATIPATHAKSAARSAEPSSSAAVSPSKDTRGIAAMSTAGLEWHDLEGHAICQPLRSSCSIWTVWSSASVAMCNESSRTWAGSNGFQSFS
ncbi:hypothetical protein BC831DRAFT_466397 [Entophlyctis helioformis]|nr:hypothetical protein BC831DRAFT_466397 [Entophlyctis helioformis]